MIVVAEGFATVGALPRSELNHFVNTIVAEGVATCLDNSILEILPADCAVGELTKHFMLF